MFKAWIIIYRSAIIRTTFIKTVTTITPAIEKKYYKLVLDKHREKQIIILDKITTTKSIKIYKT